MEKAKTMLGVSRNKNFVAKPKSRNYEAEKNDNKKKGAANRVTSARQYFIICVYAATMSLLMMR